MRGMRHCIAICLMGAIYVDPCGTTEVVPSHKMANLEIVD